MWQEARPDPDFSAADAFAVATVRTERGIYEWGGVNLRQKTDAQIVA